MARRRREEEMKILHDPKHGSIDVAKFINAVMQYGKKTVAQKIVYSALDQAETESGRAGFEIFEQAIRNATPAIELRSRRVGGANYQVPIEVSRHRQFFLASKWIINAARSHSGRSMSDRLASELISAANNEGGAIKKKEDTHRMAEANRAFAHFR